MRLPFEKGNSAFNPRRDHGQWHVMGTREWLGKLVCILLRSGLRANQDLKTATLIKARKYMLAQMITLRMATRSEEVEMAAFKAQIAIYHSEGRGLKEMVSGLREAFSAWVTRTRTQARDSKLNETQQQDAREAMNREMSTQQDSHLLLNAHGTKRKKPEIWEVGLIMVKKQRVQAAEDRMDTSS